MPIPILGMVGIGISAYLAYVHYKEVEPVCLPITDCNAVLSSHYSAIWGVPLSILGLLMYIVLTILGFWHLRKRNEGQAVMALGIYTVALSGTLFSAYLYYLEIFVIQAFCTWCIASSLVMVSTLVISIINLSSTRQHLGEVPRLVRLRVRRYVQW